MLCETSLHVAVRSRKDLLDKNDLVIYFRITTLVIVSLVGWTHSCMLEMVTFVDAVQFWFKLLNPAHPSIKVLVKYINDLSTVHF